MDLIYRLHGRQRMQREAAFFKAGGERMGYNIAIDGPAGAGKSTIAKRCRYRGNVPGACNLFSQSGAWHR